MSMSNLDSNALEAACASVDYPADVWQRKLLVEKAITAYQAALPSDGLAGRLLDEMSAEIAALMTAIACSDPYSELKVRGFDLAKKFTALKQAIAAAALLAREDWQPFNVNSHVKIKPTEVGRLAYSRWHQCLGLGVREIKVDGDGWAKMQLWDVMAKFGSAMGNGFPVPFDTEILLEPAAPTGKEQETK